MHLSDEPWAQIAAAFPQRRGRIGCEPKVSNRLACEAVPCRARTGCPWRDLLSEYGDAPPAPGALAAGVKGGVPQQAMVAWDLSAAKRGKLDLSLALIDPPSVRANSLAAGARQETSCKRSVAG